MRVRNRVIFAIHNFFQQNDFLQMDAPIFTGNACEGTSTLFETDFYGRPAYLSQSGQLYGEALAMAHGKIYTFGPTFRAEKSKTRRHLSEFWMIEPEMAFYDLDMNMDLIEQFLKAVVKDVTEFCKEELEILERNTAFLENAINLKFPRIHYDDAVAIIRGEKDVDGKNSILTLENDLKEINDKLGHSTGDVALVHLAKVVKSIIRSTDVLARYGGEEFIIILPGTKEDDAIEVIKGVQRDLTKNFFLQNNERVLITFSAGVAERFSNETVDEVLPRADAALYMAKQTGRNRVIGASELKQ